MSGRKPDAVWVYFTRKTTTGKSGCKAICNHCKKEMQGLVVRMKQHLEWCRSGTGEEQVQVENENAPQIEPDVEILPSSSSSASKRPVSCGPDSTQIPSTSKIKKQKVCSSSKRMDEFVVKTSSAEKTALDAQVARFIYGTNSAFRIAEHKEFIKLVDMLRPGYAPPSRFDIAGRLLETVHSEVEQSMESKLNGATVCMSLDGWSNVSNEPIVAVSVTDAEGDVYLVNSVDTSGNSHTAEYLAELAKGTIIDTNKKYNCVTKSFVTDNAANVAKMREQLSRKDVDNSDDKDEGKIDIISYGCSSHILNLLSHDVEITGVKEHVVEIIKYFRNNHFASAQYRKEGGTAPCLPLDVRWNSLADSLDSYIKNWATLCKVCEDYRDKIDVGVGNKVRNIAIKRNAENYLSYLKHISVALDKVQRNDCLISECVEVWIKLVNELKEDDVSVSVVKKAIARMNMAHTPAHYLANLLSPRYRGKSLKNSDLEVALEYAESNYAACLPTIIKYRASATPFSKTLFSESVVEKVTPLSWWLSLADQIDPESLEMAKQLHTAIASTAGLERIFSTFGFVHSKIRNRLGAAKAAKLTAIFRELNKQ